MLPRSDQGNGAAFRIERGAWARLVRALLDSIRCTA